MEKSHDIQLSQEKDEHGKQFVISTDGTTTFGRMESESGLADVPIKLSEGIITNPATKEGYGLVHIEARHGEEIRNAGFISVVDFVEEVAKNYEIIREGNERDGYKTYILQLTDKNNNTLMVELSAREFLGSFLCLVNQEFTRAACSKDTNEKQNVPKSFLRCFLGTKVQIFRETTKSS